MRTRWRVFLGSVLALAAGAGGFWLWRERAPLPPPVARVEPAADAPAAPPASALPPAVRHPIDASGAADLPALARSDAAVTEALVELLGRKDVQGFLQLDGFVRRAVATVDNLGRAQAAARLWPVVPTPGRFTAVERGGESFIADANAARYTAFVRFANSIDVAKAAALYVRLYPLFQSAYEELGYPGRPFNDRLVDVIDLLLQTPEPAGSIALTLTDVQGPIASTRPWVRYEFADPALEARPAGQKILLRMGVAHQQLLKARLREFRARIARP